MISGFCVECVTQKAVSLPVSSSRKRKKKYPKKYSKITQPSLCYIQVYNNYGIQKPQLWSNDRDQCIKISFSFGLKIISLSLLLTHMSCVHVKGGEHRCYGRCRPWWGSCGAQPLPGLGEPWVMAHCPATSHFMTGEIPPPFHFCCSMKHS